jgi:hypothetical protein
MGEEISFTSLNSVYACYRLKDGQIVHFHEQSMNAPKTGNESESEEEILKLTTMITGIPTSELGIIKIKGELSHDVGYIVDIRKKELKTREDTRIKKK